MPHSLTVVGSLALDYIEHKGRRYDDLLGGSASFFATAASYFSQPRVVAVIGDDFPQEHLDFFAKRGIALEGVEKARGKTFRWSGRYSDDLSHRTSLDTQLNVFADFRPKLPAGWKETELLFLGNIHPTLQLEVLEAVKRPQLVAMDTMNFWIEGEPQALAKVLQKIDLLIVNDEEARQLAREHALPRAAKAIHAMGPKSVIIKRGDAGALLFHDGQVFAAPAYPLDSVVDPTGAGDTFAGGFMGALACSTHLDGLAIRRAMYYGSVMASFCVEAMSLDRMRDLDGKAIDARYRAFRSLTHFEDLKIDLRG